MSERKHDSYKRAREELESASLNDKTCIRVSFQYGDHRVLSFEQHPVLYTQSVINEHFKFVEELKIIHRCHQVNCFLMAV